MDTETKKYLASQFAANKKYLDRRFEQVDKRFEQVDKRFEQVDRRFDSIDKRFCLMKNYVDDRFATKEDLERFATKDDFNRHTELLDHIVGELQEMRIERALYLAKWERSEEKLENHEGRIVVLEKQAA